MSKLSDKLGKRVAIVPGNKPAAYDQRQLDIHAPNHDYHTHKKLKTMSTQSVKITHTDGDNKQYRQVNNSINAPSKNGFNEE